MSKATTSALTPRQKATLAVIQDYPGFPSRTIARFVMQKHPGFYQDLEAARKDVRRMRGADGERCRKKWPKTRPDGSHTDGVYPLPEPLPDSPEAWKVVHIDYDKCFMLSDVHVPFHDKQAVAVAIAHARRHNPDLVFLNGDIADFYNCSSFDRNPMRRFRLADEIEHAKAFLEHLRDQFPKARIVYLKGNHEERLERVVWRDCPDLAGVMNPDGTPCVDLFQLLDCKNFGIEGIGNKNPALLGKHLYVLHGHEFRFPLTQAVNPARGLFQRIFTNGICGDLHKTSNHTEPSIERAVSTWSLGCLCNLRPAYMPMNKWNHGFAMIESHKGNWSVSNHKIINGNVV